jgi:Fic family protein
MPRKAEIYTNIDVLHERFKKASKNQQSLLRVLTEAEIPEHVYNSNAIENSTLTLEETEKILLQLDLDRYVTEREIFEAKNLARVMAYLEGNTNKKLTDKSILLFHKMLLGNIGDDIAGRWRTGNEWVRVGSHIGADPAEVKKRIKEAIKAFYTADEDESVITRIARFHLEFEHIHPFVDGNGRIGRLLNNYLLLEAGYVPINVAFVNRTQYYDALRAYDDKEDTKAMEGIIGLALSNSLHKRLAYLEGKQIITLNEYSKQEKQVHANLINKAKRQTIAAFLEKGIWKIGVQ